jgi:hypothetical protein
MHCCTASRFLSYERWFAMLSYKWCKTWYQAIYWYMHVFKMCLSTFYITHYEFSQYLSKRLISHHAWLWYCCRNVQKTVCVLAAKNEAFSHIITKEYIKRIKQVSFQCSLKVTKFCHHHPHPPNTHDTCRNTERAHVLSIMLSYFNLT